MRPRYKVSRAGIELIESFEGLRRKSARLPDGRWTIGYGHTLSAREGAEVSAEDAEALLLFDLMPVVEAVNSLVFTPLTQNQFDALAAFAFNIGVESFRHSDVLKRVNEGRLTEAALALDLWRRAEVGGARVTLDALIRRRAAEKALFLTPPEGFVPTPSALVQPAADPGAAVYLPRRRPTEHEAPLHGELAEVRLVGPIEPDTDLEAELAHLAPAEPQPAPVAVAPTPEVAAETVVSEPVVSEPVEVVAPAAPALEAPEAEVAETPAVVAEAPATVSLEPPSSVWDVETPQERAVEVVETFEPGAEAIGIPKAAPETSAEPEPESEAAPEPEPGVAFHPEPEPAAPAWAAPVEAPAPAPSLEPATAEPVAAPEPKPEPEPVFEPAPAELLPEPPLRLNEAEAEAEPRQPAARAIPAEAPSMRIFSSYGPMGFAALPNKPILRSVDGVPVGATSATPAAASTDAEPPLTLHPVEPEPAPVAPPAPESVSTFGPPFVPQPAALAEIAPAPAVTAEVEAVQSLVLTPPPVEWGRDPRSAPMVTALATDVDELQTPLFEEAWDGGSGLRGRVVRHESVDEDGREEEGERPPTGPFVLLGFIGMAAFGGALFAFLKARAAGSSAGGPLDDPAILAWVLALIGAACVGTSVYFLLKKLGGVED